MNAFHQTAARRIARGAMQQPDVQCRAGRFECVGVIDFRVVRIQLKAGSMVRPTAQQRIDQHVKVFTVIIARVDRITAMAIHERTEVRFPDAVDVEHIGAVFEVADPQGVRLIASPTAANLLLGDSQFQSRGSGLLEMPVECRFGQCLLEFVLEELIDGFFAAARLVLLQFDRPVDHRLAFPAILARLATVATSLPQQRIETTVAILLPLSVEGGSARLLALSVREKMLGFGQFAQKVSGLFRRNLSAEEWLEQRTPENGPLFVTIRSIRHAASPWHTFSIV